MVRDALKVRSSPRTDIKYQGDGMKLQVMLVFLIMFNKTILAQPRRNAPVPQQPSIVYVPVGVNLQSQQEIDPLKKDEEIDRQLFTHFISILGNFGKILINPDDKQNVTTNVANMINGIIAVAQTVTKTHRSPVGLTRIIAAFMKRLQQQNELRKRLAQQRIHQMRIAS